jgi:xanthine dehydrogenase molybdenum-binding subunit
VVNPSFFEYRLPLAPEVPLVEAIIVEDPVGGGAFGAKGVGETGCFPVPAAIANAIYDAVGVRITEVPLTAERVLEALRAKNAVLESTGG